MAWPCRENVNRNLNQKVSESKTYEKRRIGGPKKHKNQRIEELLLKRGKILSELR